MLNANLIFKKLKSICTFVLLYGLKNTLKQQQQTK